MTVLDESDTTHVKGGNTQDVHMNHEQSTHTDNYREEEETDDNPEFVIQQNHSQQQFIYCFRNPCITDERNRQI